MWVDAGGQEGTAPARWGAPSVYPPTALALLSPLSALPWKFAQPIWCGLNLAALAVLLICMHQLAGVKWFEARSLCMIAMMLAFEPVSTTIALGQPSIIVAALAAASIMAGTRGRESRSGLLEGLALGLKPQLAIAFAAPYVLARRWRYSVVVAGTIAIVGAVALVRLVADSQWIANYLANLHFAFGPGGANDAGPLNPNRIEFINLGYLFSLFLTSRSLCEGLAWLVGLSLALPGLKGARPPANGNDVAGMRSAPGGGRAAGFLSQSLRRGGARVPDGVGVVARSSSQAELAGAAGFRLLHIARWCGGSASGSVTLYPARHILERSLANDHTAVSSVGAANHCGLDVLLPGAF